MLPETVNSTLVFDECVKIRKDTLKLDDNSLYDYYTILTAPAAVMIIAKTEDDCFILNMEYRHPVGQSILSCPGGCLSKEEPPLEGALRELIEETGYSSDLLRLIGESFPFPGLSPQKTYYVEATNCKKIGSPQLERAEFIDTLLMSTEEVRAYIASGRPVDGLLCAALYFHSLLKTN